MALDILAQGRLVKPAQSRTGGGGREFATAQIAVATDADDSALLSLIAFRRDVVGALLALAVGDAVAVAGRAKLTAWADKSTGEPRAGLSVVVDQLLTAYHVDRRRKAAQGDDRAPDDAHPVRTPDRRTGARDSRRSLPAVAGGIAELADDVPFG